MIRQDERISELFGFTWRSYRYWRALEQGVVREVFEETGIEILIDH
jgi:8-oxo-dGTP pyrophosphatase MutT (NUDIX family)